jgi:hypothetical protein
MVTLQRRIAKREARTGVEPLARETGGVRRVINLITVGDNT